MMKAYVSILIGLAMLAVSLGATNCGVEPCELTMGAPLTVLSVSPSHGAVSINNETDIILVFSDSMTKANADAHISLHDDSNRIDTTIQLNDDAKIITMTPDASLDFGTTYYIRLAPELAGENLGELGVGLEYSFTTF